MSRNKEVKQVEARGDATRPFEVMLDIESLSTRPDAVILVIAAIKFTRKGKLPKLNDMDTFYRRIKIESCLGYGLRIDESTVKWWETQSPEMRYEALQHPDRSDLPVVLQEFAEWFKPCEKIWANSPDFDCAILGEAYTRCGIEKPWKFWDTRCCRTIYDLAGIRKADLPTGKEHHALHDCYRQIAGVKMAFSRLLN